MSARHQYRVSIERTRIIVKGGTGRPAYKRHTLRTGMSQEQAGVFMFWARTHYPLPTNLHYVVLIA